MANPKFPTVDIEHSTCRVTKYASLHVFPHLDQDCIKRIHSMISMVQTSFLFDDWSAEDVDRLVASILLHDPSAFHQNHNLDRICVSFGVEVFRIIQQYIDLSNMNIPSCPNKIALNMYILRTFADISCSLIRAHESAARIYFIKSWKNYKKLEAYDLISPVEEEDDNIA
jgi:hypothetical protein